MKIAFTRQHLTAGLLSSRCHGGRRGAQWRHLLVANGAASCLTVFDRLEAVSVTAATAVSEQETLV